MPMHVNSSGTSGAGDPDHTQSKRTAEDDTRTADAPSRARTFSGPGGTAPPPRPKARSGTEAEQAGARELGDPWEARFQAMPVTVREVTNSQLMGSSGPVRLVDIEEDPALFRQAMEQLPIEVLQWMPAMQQDHTVEKVCDHWLADSAGGTRRAAVIMPANGSTLPERMTLGVISLDKRRLVAHPEFSKVMPSAAYPGATTAGERPLEELVAAGDVWESATYLNPDQRAHYPGGLVNQVAKLIINDWMMQAEGASTGKRPSVFSVVDCGAPEIEPTSGDAGQRKRPANEKSLSAMERLAGPPVAMLEEPSRRKDEILRYVAIFELTPEKMLGDARGAAPGGEQSVKAGVEARILDELTRSPDNPWMGAISPQEAAGWDESYEVLKREVLE